MKTKALRLYGAQDLRLEEFQLPEITEEEVLIRVVSDSVCASTYKAVKQGTAHKRGMLRRLSRIFPVLLR